MMVKDLRQFKFAKYYTKIGFTKEDSYYLLKNQAKKK